MKTNWSADLSDGLAAAIIDQTEISINWTTDYEHPKKKEPSLQGQKFNPNPKFLGTAEAYFVCHISPIF